jgi:hypothetical protein
MEPEYISTETGIHPENAASKIENCACTGNNKLRNSIDINNESEV